MVNYISDINRGIAGLFGLPTHDKGYDGGKLVEKINKIFNGFLSIFFGNKTGTKKTTYTASVQKPKVQIKTITPHQSEAANKFEMIARNYPKYPLPDIQEQASFSELETSLEDSIREIKQLHSEKKTSNESLNKEMRTINSKLIDSLRELNEEHTTTIQNKYVEWLDNFYIAKEGLTVNGAPQDPDLVLKILNNKPSNELKPNAQGAIELDIPALRALEPPKDIKTFFIEI